MKTKGLYTLLMLLIMATLSAQNKTITAAADPWPPFVDSDNPTDGLALEIIRAAYKTQGYTVKMQYVPWARAVKGINEGAYDILPDVWFSDEKSKTMIFSKEAITSNEIKFIKKKGDKFEYDNLASLTGKKVGTVRGYTYTDEFMKATNFTREDVADLIQSIKKLNIGRIDLALEDEIVARARITKETPELSDKIEFTKKAISVQKMFIAAGRANPKHTEIINAFDKGFEIIKKDGTYSKIMAKYGIK